MLEGGPAATELQQLQQRGGIKSRPGGRQCRGESLAGRCASTRNTPAYVSTRQHMSAYVSNRQHTPAEQGYEAHHIRQRHGASAGPDACIRQHSSAYVSTHQHTSDAHTTYANGTEHICRMSGLSMRAGGSGTTRRTAWELGPPLRSAGG
jgi:hypothetical protein